LLRALGIKQGYYTQGHYTGKIEQLLAVKRYFRLIQLNSQSDRLFASASH